jgi:diguanylate cyclase (GGDEF)-like protein
VRTPDIPADEQIRLQTLRSLNLLDTPPEERFDRLTRMAKRLFGVPIVLVSLVDQNRQWFKSNVGLEVSETSRDISFCGHAILGEEVFIVPDALADERFADNPLVLNEPHIRFYAGALLRGPDGRKLGTLCVIDHQPRSFGQDDIEALEDLASMVERELTAIEMATVDELTKIPNRRGFMLLAQHSLNLCRRQNIPAVLVFMDLDKFKTINDRFGHREGDLALSAFAEQMRTVCRESDTLARLGGDEFAAFLTNTNEELAVNVVARFTQEMARYNQRAKRGYEISFSHGMVEMIQDKHRTIEALLADSDALMYEMKAAER